MILGLPDSAEVSQPHIPNCDQLHRTPLASSPMHHRCRIVVAVRLLICATMPPCAHAAITTLRALGVPKTPIQHLFYNDFTDDTTNLLDPMVSMKNLLATGIGLIKLDGARAIREYYR